MRSHIALANDHLIFSQTKPGLPGAANMIWSSSASILASASIFLDQTLLASFN
jgi:hypothetical protein